MHPLPIAKPPWKSLGRRLESSVRKALYEFKLLDGVQKLALALSGGKDSLTLLYLLSAISGRGFPPFELHAIHVNGAFSCGASLQESYLRSICQELNVNFVVQSSSRKLEELECYSCSRERRRLIFDAAKNLGIETIAFGHHRDDLAQTLLLNLLHKGEFAGMLPQIKMVDFDVTIIRPLIFVAEREIKQFALENNFARMTCQCPVGAQSMRKKVDRLITEMEELFPYVRDNLARSSLIYGSQKARKQEHGKCN